MSTLLKGSLIAIGALCVLLAAGAFPLMGAPQIYKGGMLFSTCVLTTLMILWAGFRLSKGMRLQFICGLVSTFFAITGLVVVWQFGSHAIQYAKIGGAMWFGAIGMGSITIVGLLFVAIFGYLSQRLMTHKLWLAGAHWSLALLAVGAYIDYCGETTGSLQLPADGHTELTELVTPEGTRYPLGFSLKAKSFTVDHYEDTISYTLYSWQGGKWRPEGHPQLHNGMLTYLGECWSLESLRTAPTVDSRPFYLCPGEPARLIMQDPPPVRQYSAECLVTTDYRGRKEERTTILRVNAPISCNGWQLYLMSYQPMGKTSLLQLQARRAPGRLPAIAGMVGIIICTSFWCWSRKEGD